jgi:ssDNA-specific exonuclease RecJ
LDVTKDGKVTLEDIAKLYNVSKHPEVISKKKTAEQVYTEYMSHWDTQIADGIVTREEFEDYYKVL